MANNKFSGSQKAAALLLTFGEEIAATIFKHLNEVEIKRVGTAMSRLERLEQQDVNSILAEFYNMLTADNQRFYGDKKYTQRVINTAFKGSKDEKKMEKLVASSAYLDALESIDAQQLAEFIRNEHPQTIALILAHLSGQKMGDTIKKLPEALQTETLLRIAKLDAVSPEIIEEVDNVLKKEVQTKGDLSLNRIGGIEYVANILNVIDKKIETQVINSLEERDAELAEEIRQLMFVFDDLVKIDDRSLQELIKEVPSEQWKLALRNVDESVKECIFRNMSKRAAQMLAEDMEAMGALKISEVERSQQKILQITRNLEKQGKVIINKNGEAAYV